MNLDDIVIRPFRQTDAAEIARHANNRKIWLNMRNVFAHPYALADAAEWIDRCVAETGPPVKFAIDVGGAAIGGAGLQRLTDVARQTAEMGYWLGEPWWGRGIATKVATWITDYGFREHGFQRIQACVFAWNPASARVLEKAGYQLEGRQRRAVFKDGRFCDQLMYARIAE